jgi:hypothetical protein
MFGKRTVKLGRARSVSRSRSRTPPRVPSAFNKARQQYMKKLMNNNNDPVNYAGVNYNKPYFILPNGTIISRHSMYGAVHANIGLKKNKTPENKLVNWLINQKTKPPRRFIIMPYTGKVWFQQNVNVVI